MVCEQMPDPNLSNAYILRDPNKINMDNIPVLSEHTVSELRLFQTVSYLCRSIQGEQRLKTEEWLTQWEVSSNSQPVLIAFLNIGWPKDIDFTDEQHVSRYTKKLNRDLTLGFASATKDLTRTTERCIKQNNEIDLFEEYFASEKAENMSEEINTKTLMIFKDPN